jgi:hypothetical protein
VIRAGSRGCLSRRSYRTLPPSWLPALQERGWIPRGGLYAPARSQQCLGVAYRTTCFS